MKKIIILMSLVFLINGCVISVKTENETYETEQTELEIKERILDKIIIDSYSFGSIVIDNKKYGDIKIYDNKIVSWHYIKHHTVTKEDIVEIVESKPSVLVIGTGYYSKVKVEQTAINFLKENNIDFIIKNTKKAYKDYNQLVKEGRNVAAILHSTC